MLKNAVAFLPALSRRLSVLLLAAAFSTAFAQVPARLPESRSGAQCTEENGYSKDTRYDAIIVGAGLSGISAANELRHLGKRVLLLESNDRIGGRGYVGLIGHEAVPIDYGGAWIHGVETNPLTGMVDAAGFNRARTQLETRYYLDGHLADTKQTMLFDDAVKEFEESLEGASHASQNAHSLDQFACKEYKATKENQDAVCKLLSNMVPKEVDLSKTDLCKPRPAPLPDDAFCQKAEETLHTTVDAARAYLPTSSKYKSILPLLIANAGPLESAAELSKTSAVDAAEFRAGEDDLVDRGLGSFVEKLGTGLPVCINSPVTNVHYATDGVVVTAAGREYKADTALVTVSVGVLQKGVISFEPALKREKLDAIKNLQMGNMQKVIMPFKSNLFTTEKPNSWVLYEGKLPAEALAFAKRKDLPIIDGDRFVMAFVFRPLDKNLVIGFFGGDWAKALESQCDGSKWGSGLAGECDKLSIRIAQNALGDIFGHDEVAEAILPKEIQLTRWSLDATSFGAYSVAGPGLWAQREELGKPIAVGCRNRVFFAGEGTARPLYNGSYPGAYESGLKAAREIAESLSHQAEGCDK